MSRRLVLSVSVCTALLAACAAVPGAYAANINSQQAVSYSNEAYGALVRGNAKLAVNKYTLAVESRKLPADQLARALLNRALANQRLNRHYAAINDYTAALRIDALSARIRAVALYNRGLAHEKMNKPAAAIEDFTSALFLDNQFAEAYYSRANVLRQNGQYLFAISDYRKAAKFNHPQQHLPLFGEALTQEMLKQETIAKILLIKTLTIKPDFEPAKQKLVALGGKLPTLAQKRAAAQVSFNAYDTPADAVITGSIAKTGPDLVLRKEPLPQAARVPARAKAQPVPRLVIVRDRPDTPKTAMSVTPGGEDKKPVVKTAATAAPVKDAAGNTQRLEGWTVQITSQRSSEKAWNVWQKLSKRYSRLLGGTTPAVVRAEIEGRGIFYRLRLHKLDSRRDAARLCNRLKRKGASCFVARS